MKPCRTRDPRPANDHFREICDLIRTRTAAHVCFVLFSNIPQQPALFIYVSHAAAILFLLFFDTDFFYFFFKYMILYLSPLHIPVAPVGGLLTVVLVLEFESHRGEILNLFCKNKGSIDEST